MFSDIKLILPKLERKAIDTADIEDEFGKAFEEKAYKTKQYHNKHFKIKKNTYPLCHLYRILQRLHNSIISIH